MWTSPWVIDRIYKSARRKSSTLWIARGQKCGGVQTKTIITRSTGNASIWFVTAIPPRSGGAAPDTAPVEVVFEKLGAGKTRSGSVRVFCVREGGADLGEIAVSTAD